MHIRRHKTEIPGLNVTPLIDVVFILLVFFMLTTNFERFRLIGVDTPQETEESLDPDAAIVILVKADGSLDFDGEPQSLEEITANVARLAASDRSRQFLVRPEQGVTIQAALDVFQAAREAGAMAISFSEAADEDEGAGE